MQVSANGPVAGLCQPLHILRLGGWREMSSRLPGSFTQSTIQSFQLIKDSLKTEILSVSSIMHWVVERAGQRTAPTPFQ